MFPSRSHNTAFCLFPFNVTEIETSITETHYCINIKDESENNKWITCFYKYIVTKYPSLRFAPPRKLVFLSIYSVHKSFNISTAGNHVLIPIHKYVQWYAMQTQIGNSL